MANSPNEKPRRNASGKIDNLNAVLVLLTFMWTVPESNQPHGLLVHRTVVSAHDNTTALMFPDTKPMDTGISIILQQ